jgi:hypothetical protein
MPAWMSKPADPHHLPQCERLHGLTVLAARRLFGFLTKKLHGVNGVGVQKCDAITDEESGDQR